MKYSIAPFFLAVAVSLSAATLVCPPSIAGDHNVDPTCPGLGQSIFATPGTSGQVWFNDDPAQAFDTDFADLAVTFMIAPDGLSAKFTWIGSVDLSDTQLWLDSTKIFSNLSPGGPVTVPTVSGAAINLHLASEEGVFFTGSADKNSDGLIHDWATQGRIEGHTPEPATYGLFGVGLLALGLARRIVRK